LVGYYRQFYPPGATSLIPKHALDKAFKVDNKRFDEILSHVDNNLLVAPNFSPNVHSPQLLRIHKQRNDAQHSATAPASSTVDECRIYTRDFLTDIFNIVWGKDFESTSGIELVQDTEVRAFLLDAEKEFGAKNYEKVLLDSGSALASALLRVERAVIGETPRFWEMSLRSTLRGFNRDDTEIALEKIQDALTVTVKSVARMQESVLYLALGMNYSDYMRYRQRCGRVVFDGNGSSHLADTPIVDAAAAEFALAYCTDAVIQIESRVGEIEKPFGKEFWY
jgi:hypothetical protein